MKVLKYVLGILLALAVIFVLIGVFKPEIEFNTGVEVNKPVKEAWAVLMDESRMTEWLEGYRGSELLSGSKGEEGAKSKISMEYEGKTMEMTETVTAMKENEHLGLHFDSERMEQDLNIYFEAIDENKTSIKNHGLIRGKGIWARSFFALIGGQFGKNNQMINEKLKKVIEANTKDYFPVQAEMMSDSTAVEAAAGEGVQ